MNQFVEQFDLGQQLTVKFISRMTSLCFPDKHPITTNK
ncbi:hypothetical protein GARC_4292 [Paraglaciecola arctica BSs20135]|uniref:Uncharacterized protein n=1 Tax=Paraglaciecola arctica BSs20135 TaxID=493475 RepID=K6XKQ0_9ALTE|nr:hypothetical protein GARC_4292 [Paraglaciecola arctica BSs20135]